MKHFIKHILAAVFFSLFIHSNAQVQVGQDIDGEAAEDRFGIKVCMPDANTFAASGTANGGNGIGAGHVRVYRRVGNVWIQKGQDIDGEHVGDHFGESLSMPDSNTIAVGATWSTGTVFYRAGRVRIFKWNGIAWVQKGQNIDGITDYSAIGNSLSMPDSNTLAIGAVKNIIGTMDAGRALIYKWNGSAWVMKGIDLYGEGADDYAGASVSMPDANTVAVGAPNNDGAGVDAGHVRVYIWNGFGWIQKGQDIDGEAAGDLFGASVSMPDSNTIAVGAQKNDGSALDAGHVRIYKWNGIAWAQKGIDIDGVFSNDRFGCSVSMADSSIVTVGAIFNDANGDASGQTRVYRWNGSAWLQKGLNIDGEAAGDYSGSSVSMADSITIAIGAFYNDGENGLNSGHVRIYKLRGVYGTVYNDVDGNCIQGNERGIDKLSLTINPGNITVLTNSLGKWFVDYLPVGNYSVSVDSVEITGKWHATCSIVSSFSVVMGDEWTMAPPIGLQADFGVIKGVVFHDFNSSCTRETEMGLNKCRLVINPGNLIIEARADGYWESGALALGNYTVTCDSIFGSFRKTCVAVKNFQLQRYGLIDTSLLFGLKSIQPCAQPDVSINAPFLRRCFTDQKIYVQACNAYSATGALNAAYVDVELDSLLTPTSSSLSYTNLGNNKYRFNVGNLNPGQCVNFTINTTVSCAANLQQTLCIEAQLFPADSCVFDTIPATPIPGDTLIVSPCNLPWDHSSLSVDGWCANDTVYFTVTNTGSASNGNMQCQAPVRVYVDDSLVYSFPVQLNGQQSVTYSYPGNGQTWVLQADQHPLHPGNSHPNAHVEACGNMANWTPNLINNLPLDDADPIKDVYCGIVSGAYDPNDKTGFPTGLGTQHEVLPNQQLQYLIRFQNTGTDTAFTVVVRDTLDTDLNIFSVVLGVASHNYSFRMYGPRVLEWTFNNIMLPDSNVNEAASHGFLTFTVEQQPNLPNGTSILNDADIYFDYNVPVITNQTVHTINNQIHNYAVGIASNTAFQKALLKVYPNPTKGNVYVELKDISPKVEISILNVLGQQISKQQFYNVKSCNLTIEGEPGVYFVKVSSGNKTEYIKLLKL